MAARTWILRALSAHYHHLQPGALPAQRPQLKNCPDGPDQQGTRRSASTTSSASAPCTDLEQVGTAIEQAIPVGMVLGAEDGNDGASLEPAPAPAAGKDAGNGGARRKQGEIQGNAIEHQTAHAPSAGQRNPDHETQGGQVAAFALRTPDGFTTHGAATACSLPLATVCPSASTAKATSPRLGRQGELQLRPGTDRTQNLLGTICQLHAGRIRCAIVRLIEDEHARHDGAPRKCPAKAG